MQNVTEWLVYLYNFETNCNRCKIILFNTTNEQLLRSMPELHERYTIVPTINHRMILCRWINRWNYCHLYGDVTNDHFKNGNNTFFKNNALIWFNNLKARHFNFEQLYKCLWIFMDPPIKQLGLTNIDKYFLRRSWSYC